MTVSKEITQEELKKRLHYDPQTGKLFWKPLRDSRGRISLRAGREAGLHITRRGYKRINIRGRIYLLHRVIWLYIHGRFPENDIDHINRDKSDNRLCNLREVNRSINNFNSSNNSQNKSGVKGVCWKRLEKKWFAYITINEKQNSLGYYKSFDNAVCARLAAEQCLCIFDDCLYLSPAFQYVKENINENLL